MSTLQAVIASGVVLMAPVLWAALGELVSEQAGTINVGIEGVMIFGAFTTVAVYQSTGKPVAAVAAAIGIGVVCAVVLGLLYIRLGADQIVTGILFAAVAVGATTVLVDKLVGESQSAQLDTVAVPALSELPGIGPILFDHNLLVYGALLAVPGIYYVTRRSWFGLHLRAAGQRPLVIETAGLSVRRIRYIALLISCTFTAIGGATLVLSTASIFQPGVTNGRGYIALAVVVLARWNPVGAVLGAFLFGVAQALQFEVDQLPVISHIPQSFVLMAPYLIVIAAVLLIRGSRYPAAVGIPYRPAGAAHR